MLAGVDLALLQVFAGAHLREALGFVVLGRIVHVLVVERQEAVELDDRASGAQVDDAAGGLGGDVGGRALELGGFHLARRGA